MKLDFEYGHGLMSANLPDNTDVFIPGTTVPDPECLPQDWDSLYNATLESIRNPMGMPPLKELAAPGKTVVFVIPDIVKGGCQPTSHRKVSIRACLDELYAAGVEKKDILFMFSNGLHPRATVSEMKQILGEELFNEFYWTNQITSHDSEDYDHMVDLGTTGRGDPVLMNKYVFDCDIPILIGHTQGNPYGGYSGGYKHCATGITHWRSIASHHVPKVMHRDDFTPVSGHSLMRTKFDEIGMHMEEKMGHPFFCCDAVLDTYSRQIAIYSGYAKVMQPESWKLANKRTYVPFAEKKYDVMVFGMPQNFHYGNGMGTNPIQMMQALSAQVIRHKRVMKENCVIICSSICNGYFHDERWPYLRELYEMFQHDYCHQPGVYPQVPLLQRLPPLPRLLHDELRPHRRDEYLRHLHRGRSGARHCPWHGPQDPGHLRGGSGGRQEEVRGREPQHPGSAPDLQAGRRPSVHEGRRSEQRVRRALSC